MKVCFFSPYLPNSSVGGGEKHLFDMALVVARKHQVFIAINQDFWQEPDEMVKKYEQFLGKSLDSLNFIKTPLFSNQANFLKKMRWTKQFDYLFYWTDGSLFFSLAKTNNLHLQIPFTNQLSFLDKLKLQSWRLKNSNSEFTRKIVEKSWRTKINFVHYPMVNLAELKSNLPKEKIILSVGRFFRQLHSKRQDALVELFKKLCKEHPRLMRGYSLVLIGAVEDESYVAEVKKLAKGLRVEFYHDISREELIKWYKRAKVYWHATGYGVDELKHPEKVEHFGITTLEAMGAGTIPIVIDKGGQSEILAGELSSLLWRSDSQAVATTVKVLENPNLRQEYRALIKKRVVEFDQPEFERRVWEMFERSV